MIIVFFAVSILCWLDLYDALPNTPMFRNMFLILPSLPPPLSWWPQSLLRFLLVFLSVLLTYLSDVVQEAVGRAQGPWALSPVPGYVSFWVIRAIVFSISDILNVRFSTSDNAYALASLYFLRVALNSWVSNDIACFTFDALVWPVAVEAPRDTSSGGCTSLTNKEV